MAVPFGADSHSDIQATLIDQLRQSFASLPDARTGKNTTYDMLDAGLSAFSVFFMQSPSFLAHQEAMQKASGHSNAETLFGIHKIPSDNQIRNLLDTVPPETLYPLYRFVFSELKVAGKVDKFSVLDNQLLIALDGTEYHSSTKVSCQNCSTTLQKNKVTRYAHTALTPVVVSPEQTDVIPLPPEFVMPQDGEEKQDCELNAATRWLQREHSYLPDNITILGDDLYCHQPWCETLFSHNCNFILVCKPASHKTLYEWVEDFERLGDVSYYEQRLWTGKKHITTRYRFINQVPLRDSDDAMHINWCEITEIDDQGKQGYS